MNTITIILILSFMVCVICLVDLVIKIVRKKKNKMMGAILALISASVTFFSVEKMSDIDITAGDEIHSNDIIKMSTYVPFAEIYYTTDKSLVEEKGIRYIDGIKLTQENLRDKKVTIAYKVKFLNMWLSISGEKTYDVVDENDIIADTTDYFEESNVDTIINTSDYNIKSYFNVDSNSNKVSIINGSLILLRTASGCYLSLNEDNYYYANKTHIDESCVIRVEITDDNYTGFCNFKDNSYATAEINKEPYYLSSNKSYMQSWECFTLYKNDEYVRISSQGRENDNSPYKYITCEEKTDNKPLSVNCKDPKAWENFSVLIYIPDRRCWVNLFTNEIIEDTLFD